MSLHCPKCDGTTKVHNTRKRDAGRVIQRQFLCLECDCRFSSRETYYKVGGKSVAFKIDSATYDLAVLMNAFHDVMKGKPQ